MNQPKSNEQQFIEALSKRKQRFKKLPNIDDGFHPEKSGGRGNAYRYTKSGYREDIKLSTRSAWEADFARILTIHGIKFEFEPQKFEFPIKRGTKSYIPDFKINDTWIEIKGWLDPKSVLKLKRFKRYYPDEFENLILLISKSNKSAQKIASEIGIKQVLFFEEFSKLYKERIPNWESKI